MFIEGTELIEMIMRKRELLQTYIEQNRKTLYTVALARLGDDYNSDAEMMAERLEKIDKENKDDCCEVCFRFTEEAYCAHAKAAGNVGNRLARRLFSEKGEFELYFFVNAQSTKILRALADSLIFLTELRMDVPQIGYTCIDAKEKENPRLYDAFVRAGKRYAEMAKYVSKSEKLAEIYSYTASDFSKKDIAAIKNQLESSDSGKQGELRFYFMDEEKAEDAILAYQYLPQNSPFSSDGSFTLPLGLETKDRKVLEKLGLQTAETLAENYSLPIVRSVVLAL